MAAAGLPKEEIDALVFAMCRPYTLQKYFATFLANYLRLPLGGTIMEVLGNGMTGGLAFDQAVNTVALGQADVALALGINMESQAASAEHMMSTMRATGDVDFHTIFGFHPVRDSQDFRPGFRQELILQQFTDVLPVNEFLL